MKQKQGFYNNLFDEEFERISIDRIKRFYKLASKMGLEVCVGFSGGKDSQVVLDLCKRADIPFKAYFNHSFESSITLNFIRKYYPEVIWRKDYNIGFVRNIYVNHGGLLPTVETAYCCVNYKHNPKYVDKCSIIGVRKAESLKRRERTTLEIKNKTLRKKNKDLIDAYFSENCQSLGTASIIQLKPIIDWHDTDVWNYIYKYHLPINPEYDYYNRVGCIVCPKANFTRNYVGLMRHPKLVDAFIRAHEKGKNIDWIITSDNNKDYSSDRVYYICRWLNHSFRQFSKKEELLYRQFREYYNTIKGK